MLVEEKVTIAHDVQVQVDRIVASEQFRTCQVLRRLLLFLTERTLAGDADNLKEYVIAIDGLGKASTYDRSTIPRCGFRWDVCGSGWRSTTGRKARTIRSWWNCPRGTFALPSNTGQRP